MDDIFKGQIKLLDTRRLSILFRRNWYIFSTPNWTFSTPDSNSLCIYFVESTSTIVTSGQNELIYAVFSTPYNSIRASAVCVFSMESVRRIFSQSAYKAQSAPNANWLPILRSQVPQPRPGDVRFLINSKLLASQSSFNGMIF